VIGANDCDDNEEDKLDRNERLDEQAKSVRGRRAKRCEEERRRCFDFNCDSIIRLPIGLKERDQGIKCEQIFGQKGVDDWGSAGQQRTRERVESTRHVDTDQKRRAKGE
jgi:hypothetical protein